MSVKNRCCVSASNRKAEILPTKICFRMRRILPVALAQALLTALAVTAQTNQPPVNNTQNNPNASEAKDLLATLKHPTSWLTWGGDVRYRDEYFNNAVSLTHTDRLHETDVQRFRERLWMSATAAPGLSFNARLVAEPREWMEPSFAGAYKAQSGMEWRYGMADVLNVKWTPVQGQPLSLTLGRQDILPGEISDGWLVGDGTPLDGSMTFYFDAARAQYLAEPIKTKFDLIYIYQNPLPGEWIPTIGNSDSYPLSEQREQGIVLYAANKSIENVELDGYAIYKNDRRETFNIAGVRKTPGDNADIYTLGGRILGTPSAHWQYSAEGAYQFGWKEDKIQGVFASRDIAAYGGKANLTYLFKDKLNNQVSLNGEFLSGDDPKTPGKDEMFDILWGRWPRWSDLYAYSYTAEVGGRTAQFNNLGRIGPSWVFNPMPKMTFGATYNAMLAPETAATRGNPALFSNNGNFRGHYVQTFLKYQFSKHVAGHLWGEWVWQGDYYKQRDLMSFLRAEVTFTF